ncbi:S1 family peptidase [Rugamonas rivuli]|uniref:S1 family peptidase n=1 Tax=Rugamonas rivuli TaxID=2743358 RepID=UPI001581B5B4|nr:serine protease [Rugamonas rivuli]
MITANVLQRIFCISIGQKTGTAFVLDIDERQYMITAAHLLPDSFSGSDVPLEIKRGADWESVPAKLVGMTPFGADIAVFALPTLLAHPSLTLPIIESTTYGQDVYFLGFPYGKFFQLGPMNNHYPTPYVKRGIVSGFNTGGTPSLVFIDGLNNPGFSGGPVVGRKPNSNEFELIAVVSCYDTVEGEVLRRGLPDQELSIDVNIGIIETVAAQHARTIARDNPIGCLLSTPISD